jgi:hypothetical protein
MIASIAMEQFALSHLLIAEGEKLQKAIAMAVTSDELIDINASVKDLVSEVSEIEEKLVCLMQNAMIMCGCDIANCENTNCCGKTDTPDATPDTPQPKRKALTFDMPPQPDPPRKRKPSTRR